LGLNKERLTRSAFTLLELIVTIVIIGILAGLAIPMFPRAIESTKANTAVAGLQSIRSGERIYRVEEGTYWPTEGSESNIDTINDTLRTLLDTRAARSWNYSVDADTPDVFTATATRRSGSNSGETIMIDQDGFVDKSGWSP
jgi:prepilin-type N-terminal cleavage/methylation domain-containing protein